MVDDLYIFAEKQGLNESRVIDAGSGISPLGPSRKVKAAVRKAIRDIAVYPDSSLSGLRRFFSSKFGLPGESLLFANSLYELIYLIPAVFRPARVLVAGLPLGVYEEASASAGADVSYIISREDSGFLLDTGAIKQNLKGIDLLFISNPDRVTGRLTDRKDLFETLKYASAKKVLVVLDESLIEFTRDDAYYENVFPGDRIIVLRTTANFYGLPGLELAWAASSAPLIGELNAGKHWHINTLAVEAARTALKDKTYRKLTRDFVDGEKRLLLKSLKKIEGITYYDSDSNMLLVKLRNPDERLLTSLAVAGFFIRDGSGVKGLDRSFLRLSIMGHDKNKKLLRILRETYGKDRN